MTIIIFLGNWWIERHVINAVVTQNSSAQINFNLDRAGHVVGFASCISPSSLSNRQIVIGIRKTDNSRFETDADFSNQEVSQLRATMINGAGGTAQINCIFTIFMRK